MRSYVSKLLPVLLGATVSMTACGKKKHKSSTDDSSTPTSSTGGSSTGGTTVDNAVVSAPTSELKLASTLNLISLGASGAGLNLAPPDDSEFNTDQDNLHGDDKTLNKLQNIGNILCFLNNTGYNIDAIVNAGPQAAQVDMMSCFHDGGNGGGQNGSQNSKQVMMIPVTVDATRETGKPLHVKMWFDMQDHDGGDSVDHMKIAVSVAQGTSDTNPLGIFRLTFHQDTEFSDGTITPSGHGQIETHLDSAGALILTYIEDDDKEFGGQVLNKEQDQVAARLSFSGSHVVGGAATIVSSSSGNSYQGAYSDSQSFQMAWKEGTQGLFYAHDNVASTDVCRSEQTVSAAIWRYGVYDATTGKPVQMRGGFPITFTKDDGTTGHGWASYYGIWADGETLADGASVTQEGNGDAGAKGATYKVVTGPGKLTKHVRTALTLAELDGIDLSFWSESGQSRVSYDKSTGKFMLTGTMSNSNGGGGNQDWTDVTPTQFTFNKYGNHSAWSEALGGRVDIILDANSAPTAAAIYSEEDVTGKAGDMTLYCMQNCAKGNITSAMLTANTEYNAPDPTNPWQPYDLTAALSYTFNQSQHVLKDASGNPVALVSGQTVPSGSMVPYMSALVDLTTLNSMKTAGAQPWDAGSQDVSYSWNVGDPSQSWTQFQTLVDANGTVVAFDPPMHFTYTHSQDYDFSYVFAQGNGTTDTSGSKFWGKTFHLQYDGSNLMLPSHMDNDTGFWVNDFALAKGAMSADGAYIFRPLDGALYMKSVDASNCTGAGLDYKSAPPAPALSTYDASKENTDAAPDVSGQPTAIVNGVYQL